MNIKISADSTCDLPRSLAEQYGIDIVNLYVVKDGQSLIDSVDITPDEIYAHVENGGDMCSTAAVSEYDYIKVLSKKRESADEVVQLHISAEMSACYQNACLAATEVEGVYPVDTKTLSTGMSLLALEAAEMAKEEGMTGAKIQAYLNQRREKLDVSFLVERLDYLRKGGRCSAVAALGANMLSLRPCIQVKEGKMGVGKKYRGAYSKCLLQYVKERLEGRDDIDTRRIFVTNSGGFTDEDVQAVVDEVRKYQPFEEVICNRAGCTISCHCGPRTLGILYFHK